ncbi:hypothetical protein [Paenibacillus sp. Soil522]|uniref:hypothetical protein n=1 Tax=Paenibacillus sp. Soil522 TaxID=1736388 RepID=UPI000701D687|nr:hypothetical protein [Paenibacillus sp. Soil522]KRE39992.1 hypothetical protein ASG81_18910 [Paenibacillus sp. Soil522]
MKKKNKMLLFIGMIILLLALFRWNSTTKITTALVMVIDVKANEILVQDLSGNRETVQIPEGIYKLIVVNRQYWIKYEHREWEKPELLSIEPQ